MTSNLSDSNHPSPLWTANAYNSVGLSQATLGNGIIETVGYDTRERRTSDSFADPADNLVYNYSLGYYPNSTVQTANDKANGNWSYTVDNMNRLLTASASTGTWASDTLQWGIDAWGNLNTQTLTAGSVPVPQPSLSSNSNNQIAGYCYDQAGNLLDEGNCRLSGPQEYTYDGVGRLTSPDYGNTTYVYDASGKRVAKQSNGISNYEYLYDLSGNQITEIAAQTSYLWNSGEVYLGASHIATYIGGTTYFAHADWIGNERVHSKMDASIQDSCANLPFGDDLTCPMNGVNPFHFTGKERDAESGNDYFGARYYGSSVGRFLSPDSVGGSPENPQSWNLYSYVWNNPLTNTDPDGHDVNVCSTDSYGNQQCTEMSNEQYQAAQQGNGSLNVPTLDQVGNNQTNGTFNATAITDANGNTVGTATYVPTNPGIDPFVGNNMAGYQTLGAANKVVTYGAVGTAVVFGGVAVAAAAPEVAAVVGRWGLQRLAMGASSPALINLINRLYQAQDEIPGGTAGAVRNEVMTGEYINGGHSIKASEMITALQRLINSGQLSASDQTIAGHIISDLKNSLGR